LEADAGAALAEIFDQVPSIATGRLSVTELPGGLTNRNFKISMPEGTYVARVASGGSELLAIDRAHEHRNSVRAAAAGVGAPVIEYAPAVGVLVLGFIEGTTLANPDVAEPANLPRIARACRALHAAELPASSIFFASKIFPIAGSTKVIESVPAVPIRPIRRAPPRVKRSAAVASIVGHM